MSNRYYYDRSNATKYANGATIYRTGAPFSSIARGENVPCEDGVLRTFHTGSEPDTMWTVPGWVYVKGKTVRGFLSFRSAQDGLRYTGTLAVLGKEGPVFMAYTYRRNGHLIAQPTP